MSVGAVALCGSGTILYRYSLSCRQPPEYKELIHLAAVALSSEVADTVLIRDEESLKLFRQFIKDVFLHPDVVECLKNYVKAEFTTNTDTITALRKFVLDHIICDTWVSDELISMAKETGRSLMEDKVVYPGLSMRLLSAATWEGLQTSEFKGAFRRALRVAFWLAFMDLFPVNIAREGTRRKYCN